MAKIKKIRHHFCLRFFFRVPRVDARPLWSTITVHWPPVPVIMRPREARALVLSIFRFENFQNPTFNSDPPLRRSTRKCMILGVFSMKVMFLVVFDENYAEIYENSRRELEKT